ncbi:MAG: hypothetical protein QXL15_02020 [Candidatus Korarchaeota archaeon]
MADYNVVILYLLIATALSGLLVIFIYHATKKRRNIWELIIGLAFGVVGGFSAFFYTLLEASGIKVPILLSVELVCYGILILLFFLFLNNIISHTNVYRFLVPFALFTTMTITHVQILQFSPEFPLESHVTKTLWLYADIGYEFLSITTFLVMSLYAYLKSYIYAKDRKTLLLIMASIVIGIGYICLFTWDLLSYSGITDEILDLLSSAGDLIVFMGLLIILITYASDIDFIYKFPFDSYILMVYYNYGVMIYSTEFVSKKSKSIEEDLVGGLISSLNTIFVNVLELERDIMQQVSGKKAHILAASGKYITAAIISERMSVYLLRALRRFVKEFEDEFRKELEANENDRSKFIRANALVMNVFPYISLKPK